MQYVVIDLEMCKVKRLIKRIILITARLYKLVRFF